MFSVPVLFFFALVCVGALSFAPHAKMTARSAMTRQWDGEVKKTEKKAMTMCDETESAVVDLPVTPLSQMEIRVGKIVEISVHPEAENLFIEKVDVGEEDGPRTIVRCVKDAI